MHEILAKIRQSGIIGIIRGDYRGSEEAIVAALVDKGITAVEVTLDSPEALASIAKLALRFGPEVEVGAGTVLKPDEVLRAAEVGARYIVSPNCSRPVIEESLKHNLVSIPGCFTPSEIVQALQWGAHAIKIFPAQLGGPAYVRCLRGPLEHALFIPTGGITPEFARQYIRAGAWAVGVGSKLVNKDVLAAGGLDQLRERAGEFVQAAGEGKNQ